MAAGIVPLPLGGEDGKRPLVKHPGKFGLRAALEIAPKYPDANLGFWCGSRNGLTIVDIDSTADAEVQYAIDTYGATPIIVQTASDKAICTIAMLASGGASGPTRTTTSTSWGRVALRSPRLPNVLLVVGIGSCGAALTTCDACQRSRPAPCSSPLLSHRRENPSVGQPKWSRRSVSATTPCFGWRARWRRPPMTATRFSPRCGQRTWRSPCPCPTTNCRGLSTVRGGTASEAA